MEERKENIAKSKNATNQAQRRTALIRLDVMINGYLRGFAINTYLSTVMNSRNIVERTTEIEAAE